MKKAWAWSPHYSVAVPVKAFEEARYPKHSHCGSEYLRMNDERCAPGYLRRKISVDHLVSTIFRDSNLTGSLQQKKCLKEEYNMRLVAPETVTFTQSDFCPGCGHGWRSSDCQVMEEMGLVKNLAVVDVACGSLNMNSWRFDTVMTARTSRSWQWGIRKYIPKIRYWLTWGDGAASIEQRDHAHNDQWQCGDCSHQQQPYLQHDRRTIVCTRPSPTSTPRERPWKMGMPFRVSRAFTGFWYHIWPGGDYGRCKMIQCRKYIKNMKGEVTVWVELLFPMSLNLNMTLLRAWNTWKMRWKNASLWVG